MSQAQAKLQLPRRLCAAFLRCGGGLRCSLDPLYLFRYSGAAIEPDVVQIKPVAFLGDSLARVRSFPREARHALGYQIERVQRGLEPDDWKPLATVGLGVREIRVRDRAGAFRVIYLATSAEAVYVLNAFQKKSRQTPRLEIQLAAVRLRELKRRT